MSWTSKYNAGFAKLFIRQLMAIIQRDQRAALDFVGGLPDIQNFQLSASPTTQFPSLLLVPSRIEFDRESVGSLKSTTQLFCSIAVSHQDSDVLAEMIQDYVRALDALFNTLPLSDFYQTWPLSLRILGNINSTQPPTPTVPLQVGSVKDLYVVSHDYDYIRRTKTGFAVEGILQMLIDREEI